VRPPRRFVPRLATPVTMRELEAGDRPRDVQGRELPFAPGDQYVQLPFYAYVMARELADALYIEEED
jgi:hypothetical protein